MRFDHVKVVARDVSVLAVFYEWGLDCRPLSPITDLAVAQKVVGAGGTFLGEIVDWDTPSGSTARFVYLRDPEGNIVDLWSRL